jgi:UDP-2,3-diacylglucosamine pyrophosphatase LpxH
LSGKNFNFIVANDMGRRGESEQQNIADLMGKVAETCKIRLIAVAGEPIHDDGVKSVTDEEWKLKFENIYTAASLQKIPWYVVSGNHEYHGSVQAVLDYSTFSDRWKAPARYFYVEHALNSSGQKCLLVFIDTTPLIDKYRTGDEYSDAPQQDIETQLQWIEQTLTLSDARWKIVIGHHPVYADTEKEANERTDMQARLAPVLEKNNVTAYICGHIHNFQHICPLDSKIHYVVNSSASQSRKVQPMEGTLFCNPDPGFSIFSVSSDSITFYMVNHEGETVYNYIIKYNLLSLF